MNDLIKEGSVRDHYCEQQCIMGKRFNKLVLFFWPVDDDVILHLWTFYITSQDEQSNDDKQEA